jgi:asparagine synthase (glutamine-hydrolysing)
MCGFLGIYAPQRTKLLAEDLERFRGVARELAHRGNSGYGEEVNARTALFHYRLAFRDLAEGRQPLTDPARRATILFNGELYGFRSLRAILARDYEFRTGSDTEVILAAYLAYGENFLDHLDGEFAFVIQDHRDGSVLAARDVFGVKPLFFGSVGPSAAGLLRTYREHYEFSLEGNLNFASEMKGLPLSFRWDQRGLSRNFSSLYEEMGTTFEGIFALAPGALFVAEPGPEGWKCRLDRKIPKRRSVSASPNKSFEESARELKNLLGKTVRNKLDSEVPLGAYLSGGIDSRVAAWEMGNAGAPIETFTVGFEGADYDETADVRRFLARFPNLRGRALRTNTEALEYSYRHAIYASELLQPYTNGAAKWWLSLFARRHVRGVLTGDGSDEMFCGYPSYRYLAWWRFYHRHPSRGRAALYEARVVGSREKYWEKGLSSLPDGTDLEASVRTLGWAHPLYAQVENLSSLWLGDGAADFLRAERDDILSYVQPDRSVTPLAQWQTYFLHTHFPTHVLNWVGDRMEMANTLEGRPIFLSREILELVRGLPDHYLVRGMRDKAILRKAYQRELGQFSTAPKKQFNAPFLLEGALGREFLSDAALKSSGLIDPALVARARMHRENANDALASSFAEIFLQNCLVAQMLDRYLVRRSPPTRDLEYEGRFLEERTINL